jgi:hypothetical protein
VRLRCWVLNPLKVKLKKWRVLQNMGFWPTDNRGLDRQDSATFDPYLSGRKDAHMELNIGNFREREHWWPAKLGEPATSGSQYGRRYAYFRELRRLFVESYGKLAVYHTGDLQISGICPNSSRAMSLTFYSQDGLVDIDELRQIS